VAAATTREVATVPLDQLTGLLARWHAADSRVARARLLREASSTLRGLDDTERRELGRALTDHGIGALGQQVARGTAVWGPGGWEHQAAQELLALDTDLALDVISELETALASTSGSGRPPPPRADGHLPETDPDLGVRDPEPPGPAAAEDVTSHWQLPWTIEPATDEDASERARSRVGAAAQAAPAPAAPAPAAPAPAATDPDPPEVAATDPDPSEPAVAAPVAPVRTRSIVPGPLDAPTPAGSAATSGTRPVAGPNERSAQTVAELRELPDGWRRRRAADRLLRDGGLEEVDAGEVLSMFDRVGDRIRIAARLVAVGRIDEATLQERLPAAAGDRLVRRLARGR
jgi:hypothetical protein